MPDRVRLQHGDESRVMDALAVDGQMFDEFKPARENLRRIREHWKPLLKLGHLLCGSRATPAKTVGLDGSGGNRPELDEILRREKNLIALAEQPPERGGGDGMLRQSRIRQAEQQIRIGEAGGHQS